MATGDQADIVARIKSLLPDWFGQNTVLAPIVDGLLQGPAAVLSFVYSLISYARLQLRLATATDGWLDLIAEDFFGDTLPRVSAELDDTYRTRIRANLFPPSNTRAAISTTLIAAIGTTPRITSPWRPGETGVWDGAPGNGAMFWDVDNTTTPARWTGSLSGEFFIDLPIPPLTTLGAPYGFMPAWDRGAWDTYSFACVDISAAQMGAAATAIAIIRKLKVEGVLAFVRFTGLAGIGGAARWDEAFEVWDTGQLLRWDGTARWDEAGEAWDTGQPLRWDAM